MKNNLIGISGKIGSGKDTVGSILQYLSAGDELSKTTPNLVADWEYNWYAGTKMGNYQIKKFADKLKDIACLLIGCTREQLEDRGFKEKELGEEWWKWEITFEGNFEGYIDYVGNEKHYEDEYMIESHLIKLTPRKLLQLLGTECGREIIHPQIWVNALFADYNDNDVNPIKVRQGRLTALEAFNLSQNNKPNWIITDVRFPNEAKSIKDRGGIVIRVNRGKQCGSCESTFTKGSECPNCGSGNWVHGNIDSTHPSETALDDYEFNAVIDNNGSIEELVEKIKQLKLV